MAAPMDKTNSDNFAINLVNDKLGDDIKSLKSLMDIYNEYKEKQKTLEGQVTTKI